MRTVTDYFGGAISDFAKYTGYDVLSTVDPKKVDKQLRTLLANPGDRYGPEVMKAKIEDKKFRQQIEKAIPQPTKQKEVEGTESAQPTETEVKEGKVEL